MSDQPTMPDEMPTPPCHGSWWCQAREHLEGCFATDPHWRTDRSAYTAKRTTSLNTIANAASAITADGFLPLSVRYAIAERAIQQAEEWVADGES